jgi:hypothetical protein
LAALVVVGQTLKGRNHLPLEFLPCEERPLLKRRAVGHGEALEEGPSIQLNCFL